MYQIGGCHSKAIGPYFASHLYFFVLRGNLLVGRVKKTCQPQPQNSPNSDDSCIRLGSFGSPQFNYIKKSIFVIIPENILPRQSAFSSQATATFHSTFFIFHSTFVPPLGARGQLPCFSNASCESVLFFKMVRLCQFADSASAELEPKRPVEDRSRDIPQFQNQRLGLADTDQNRLYTSQ